MKKPYEVENEVMEKYFPIAEKRAKEYLVQLENIIEEKKEAYYIFKRITLGKDLLLTIEDQDLPQEDKYSEKKSLIKSIIRSIERGYIEEEIKKVGWKITRSDGIYYLERLED